MSERDWIDISIPLGKEIPELPLETPEGEVLRSSVKRFFDVEKGYAGPCRAVICPIP